MFTTYTIIGNIPEKHREALRAYIAATHIRYPKLRGLYAEDNKKQRYTPAEHRKIVGAAEQFSGTAKYPSVSFAVVSDIKIKETDKRCAQMLLVCMHRDTWQLDFDNILFALEGTSQLKAV